MREAAEGSPSGFDVVAVGSAIVDLLVPVEPAEVRAAGLEPGTMTLVDRAEADRLWERLGGGGTVVAGGSAANTAVGVAALGGRAALVGRVGADRLGRAYVEDLERTGVSFSAPPSGGSVGTGRCFIVVTPDGERTMRTYLGAAPELDPDPLTEPLLRDAGWVYLEGYLWDAPPAAPALEKAVALAGETGAGIALSLSDPGCVERHRREFAALVDAGQVDLLFANEAEITRLWDVGSFEEAIEVTRSRCPRAALTRGAGGSVAVAGSATARVPAVPVDVVDTTGAGDQYAAGFLLGTRRGLSLEACARLGSLAAADVVSALGARPHGDVAAAARAEGLLA